MDVQARITSKGQVTIPKVVRSALGLAQGDTVFFRVENDHAVLARTPNLAQLAGTVEVPPDVRGLDWEEIRQRARAAQVERHR